MAVVVLVFSWAGRASSTVVHDASIRSSMSLGIGYAIPLTCLSNHAIKTHFAGPIMPIASVFDT